MPIAQRMPRRDVGRLGFGVCYASTIVIKFLLYRRLGYGGNVLDNSCSKPTTKTAAQAVFRWILERDLLDGRETAVPGGDAGRPPSWASERDLAVEVVAGAS